MRLSVVDRFAAQSDNTGGFLMRLFILDHAGSAVNVPDSSRLAPRDGEANGERGA
jgi:hypothetical protein